MGTKVSPRKVTTNEIGLLRARAYRGIYSRVAKEIGVTRSVVARVGSGTKRSARIEDALRRELKRIERNLVRREQEIKNRSAA